MNHLKKLIWLPCLASVLVLMLMASCKDDDAPSIQISFASATASASEDDGAVEATVVVSKSLSSDLVVQYTLSGTASDGDDYDISPASGFITISPGTTQTKFTIELNADNVSEGDETVIITLGEVISGTATVKSAAKEFTLTITDGIPKSTISFDKVFTDMNERDGVAEVIVTLDAAAAADITIAYTLSGNATPYNESTGLGDYTDVEGGSFTIPQGETEGSLTFLIQEDFSFELYTSPSFIFWDSLMVTLSAVTAGPGILPPPSEATHGIYILEDDLLISVDWDTSAVVDFNNPQPGNSDLDLFVFADRVGDVPDAGPFVIGFSNFANDPDPDNNYEVTFIPNPPEDYNFTVSIPYYAGDPGINVGFLLTYTNFGTFLESDDFDYQEFTGSYTDGNINMYEADRENTNYYLSSVPAPSIIPIHDFTHAAGNFGGYGADLTIPASGSRKAVPLLTPINRGLSIKEIMEKLKDPKLKGPRGEAIRRYVKPQ